jgi:hypothetical protein
MCSECTTRFLRRQACADAPNSAAGSGVWRAKGYPVEMGQPNR